jgi:hypothetical protein
VKLEGGRVRSSKILVLGHSHIRNIVSYVKAQNTFFFLVSELPYQNEAFIGPEIQNIMWITSTDV